jgi:hypothetical protein
MFKINDRLLMGYATANDTLDGRHPLYNKHRSDICDRITDVCINEKSIREMSGQQKNKSIEMAILLTMKLNRFLVSLVSPMINKIALLVMLTLTLHSCNDEVWQEHYDNKILHKSDLNVYEYLKSRPDLSTFTKMVKSIGYDTVLTQNLTYTVWAPVNTVLEDVDLTDSVYVRRLVLNHISQFGYPTSVASRLKKPVLVLNNKLQNFSTTPAGTTFFDISTLAESDLAMKNGIVHILDYYSDYKKNFWEYIKETPDLDSLYKYINSLTIKELDKDKSYENTMFKDSVFKYTNYVFDNLAMLNSEDSVYTGVLPDNFAWIKAYNKIFPYLKTKESDGGVARQIADTKKLLVNNLFFNGNLKLPLSPDSIVSTSGNYFLHADRLFNGMPVNLSNGTAYVTSEIKEEPSDVWLKPTVLEAENYTIFGGVNSNYSSSILSSLGTGFTTSGNKYLSLTDVSTSSLSPISVRFPVYNYLSTRYNVYCVFVPTKSSIRDEYLPYKVTFAYSVKGTSADYDLVIDTSRVVTKVVYTSTGSSSILGKPQYTFTTKGDKVEKVLVLKNFQIPERYFYSSKTGSAAELINSIGFSIKVINATTKAEVNKPETAKFTRNIKIDCLILEPVQ